MIFTLQQIIITKFSLYLFVANWKLFGLYCATAVRDFGVCISEIKSKSRNFVCFTLYTIVLNKLVSLLCVFSTTVTINLTNPSVIIATTLETCLVNLSKFGLCCAWRNS